MQDSHFQIESRDLSHLTIDELEEYREAMVEAIVAIDSDITSALKSPLVPQEWKDLLDAVDSELLERQLLS